MSLSQDASERSDGMAPSHTPAEEQPPAADAQHTTPEPSRNGSQPEPSAPAGLTERTAEQLAALQKQAEFVLDEIWMGGADWAATGQADAASPTQAPPTPTEDSAPASGDNAAPLNEEINSLLTADAPPSEVWPEEELPTIQARRTPQPPGLPSPAQTFSQPPQATNAPGGSAPSPTAPAPGQPGGDLPPVPAPPSSSVLDTPVSPSPLLPKAPAEATASLSAADRQVMEEEILELYNAVNRILATRREITGHALSLLREANEIITAQPQRLARAEYNLQQVRQILARAQAGRRESRRYAVRTFLELIVWVTVLGTVGAGLLLYPLDAARIAAAVAAETGLSSPHTFPVLWAAVLGGIGGSLGAALSLADHLRTGQEFDRQYALRSTIQPLMGILLGLLFYFLFAVIFSALGFAITSNRLSAYLPAAIALPIGLWQEGVYALVFRLTRLLSFQRRRRW